ncbi:hypothetical protein [Glaciihabitans sp. UYNi722]|uniref:hypothetical protein n=1 Tax=Glaciihabitans sp. UYNi722 TaxID=3156344 RepID=UPI003396CD02
MNTASRMCAGLRVAEVRSESRVCLLRLHSVGLGRRWLIPMAAIPLELPRLLLIEDDPQLGPLMAQVLAETYEVTLVADGARAPLSHSNRSSR